MTAVPPEVPAEVCYRPMRSLIADAVAADLIPATDLVDLVTIPRVLSDPTRLAKVGRDGPHGQRTQAWLQARIAQLRRLVDRLREREAATSDGHEQVVLAGLRVRTREVVQRLEALCDDPH